METKTIVTQFVVTKNRQVPFHADQNKKVTQVSMHPLNQQEPESENKATWENLPEADIHMNALKADMFANAPIGTKVKVTFEYEYEAQDKQSPGTPGE